MENITKEQVTLFLRGRHHLFVASLVRETNGRALEVDDWVRLPLKRAVPSRSHRHVIGFGWI
jgi:hypothetical protein